MDSFEWNKIIGAVLGTLIFIFVVKEVADIVYEAPKPAKAGYEVEGVVEPGAATTAPVAEVIPDWGTVLPAADVAAGKTTSARCEQCHDTSAAKTNKIGPALYGVVGRARATVAGFSYSGAMKDKGGSWTYDELFKFLKSPGSYIPGTKMSFAGLRNPQDRINLIAFLRTNTDSPVAIPAPAPKAAPAAAPAAGAPTAAESTPQPGKTAGTTPPTAPAKPDTAPETGAPKVAPSPAAKNSSTGN